MNICCILERCINSTHLSNALTQLTMCKPFAQTKGLERRGIQTKTMYNSAQEMHKPTRKTLVGARRTLTSVQKNNNHKK